MSTIYDLIYKKHDKKIRKEFLEELKETEKEDIKERNRKALEAHLSNVKELIENKEWIAIEKYLKLLSIEYNFRVAKECLEVGYYNDLPYASAIFSNLIDGAKAEVERYYFGFSEHNYYRSYEHRIDEDKIVYKFTDHPILLRPWNSVRILNNSIDINQDNVLSAEKGYINLKNNYYFPLGLIVCDGGNHSQLSAILEGNGESAIEMILDMRPLYDEVVFDGNDFISKRDNRVISVINSEKEIVLNTKNLLGVYFEIGRLLKEHLEYFPTYITKYLKKWLFETRVYKNGPTKIETCLSTFGKPGEALFKVYIPTNIPIEGNDEFQYLEHFTIKQCVSEVTPFDEHFLPKIEEMKQYIHDEGLEMQGDTVFLAILPIFGQHFVEINIPIKEISDAI